MEVNLLMSTCHVKNKLETQITRSSKFANPEGAQERAGGFCSVWTLAQSRVGSRMGLPFVEWPTRLHAGDNMS